MQRIFDPRTKAVTYDTPDVARLGFDWPALKAATEDFNRLKEDLDRTVARIRELTESRQGAEDKDRQAFADAIKAGKGDPGEQHTAKVDAEISNAERRRDALRLAIQEQAGVISQVIDKHRSKWQQQVGSRIPKAQDRLEAAIREVEAARAELQGLHGLADWLAKPDESYTPREASKNTNYVVQGGINRRGQEATLSAIREEARSA